MRILIVFGGDISNLLKNTKFLYARASFRVNMSNIFLLENINYKTGFNIGGKDAMVKLTFVVRNNN